MRLKQIHGVAVENLPTADGQNFDPAKFKLLLRRKVAFYTFILIMPCALLSVLTMVIFWVPPESPAKLTLGG